MAGEVPAGGADGARGAGVIRVEIAFGTCEGERAAERGVGGG